MNRDKIIGALYGAAYGDSLGAITEFCTVEQIKSCFPKGLETYRESISHITKGTTPGVVTDDFGSSCYIMKNIIRKNGSFNRDMASAIILDWAGDEFYFQRFAGPTTKAAVETISKGILPEKRGNFMKQNTNGGAMKMAPLGILAMENRKKALEFAIDMCYPTHYNSAAVSAAAAICCAVNEAQKESASIEQIIEAGIWGASQGRRVLEEEGFGTFGPDIAWRIELAVELGRKCITLEERIDLLNEKIGTGIQVQESIPAVFGLIASTSNINEAVIAAANAGGDTDTIASMTGAILGGYCSISSISQGVIDIINNSNSGLSLKETIESYTEMVIKISKEM